jgi:Tol biopolymer transport system component
VPGSVDPPYVFGTTWLDVSGKALPLKGGPIIGPTLCRRVSADGRRLLFSYNYPGIQAEVMDVVRGSRAPATFDANPVWAIWGPGPDRITFTSDHEGPVGLYTRRPDAGPDEVELLWKPPDGSSLALGSWSPDGELLAFVRSSKGPDTDIWLLEAGKEPRPFLSTRFAEMHPDLSPDGRWLLYTSNATGQLEVFAKAVSDEGPTLHVSIGEGFESAWSRDGKHVFYWQRVKGKPVTQALYRVKVTSAPGTLELGSPERPFETYRGIATPGRSWDIGPDGRFLDMAQPDEAEERARLEKLRPSRIVVDTGGVARLIAGAKPGS